MRSLGLGPQLFQFLHTFSEVSLGLFALLALTREFVIALTTVQPECGRSPDTSKCLHLPPKQKYVLPLANPFQDWKAVCLLLLPQMRMFKREEYPGAGLGESIHGEMGMLEPRPEIAAGSPLLLPVRGTRNRRIAKSAQINSPRDWKSRSS